MTIEFHCPPGKVKEWIIDFVKSKLIEFHHLDKEIARAEVYFKEQENDSGGAKVCEIDLTVYGDSLFVHRNAESFEQASREVIEALTRDVEEQIKKQKELPDQVTSTVKA